MSEALYLTQSYVYETAEAADARFAGDEPGFVYTRYGNPTTQMFEDRLALLEGAEGVPRLRFGHVGDPHGDHGAGEGGRSYRGRAGPCSAPAAGY